MRLNVLAGSHQVQGRLAVPAGQCGVKASRANTSHDVLRQSCRMSGYADARACWRYVGLAEGTTMELSKEYLKMKSEAAGQAGEVASAQYMETLKALQFATRERLRTVQVVSL